MSALETLKQSKSLKDLADLLGYKPSAVSYIVYKIPNESKYIDFTIPKKDGGERKIRAPIGPLKNLQERLAELLGKCYEEIRVKSKHKRSLSHGFRKNHSIITNAINHKNKRHVFNIDLKDFFPSINFGRVRGYLIKNAHFELNAKVATVIAQIACHDNQLPQGSPCSPIISNLIGHLLDIRMANLAKNAKCTYSRYADDLTFSTNKNQFPGLIAVAEKKDGNEWVAGKALTREIQRVGFAINEKKTSLQYKTARQITTGLVVNEKVNIRRDYYKRARSMCHALFLTGEFYISQKKLAAPSDAGTAKESVPGSINQLEGILSYIYQVKQLHDKRAIGARRNYPTAVLKLYREFLFYKHFFSLGQPLIICEGKTDCIYLKCALRQLENEYARLVQKTADGFIFNVGFLNLSENLKKVFAISEGTPGLAAVMDLYKANMKRFKASGKKHPVIMLVDNDSGSKEIKKKLSAEDRVKPFSRYIENLYIVHIPLASDGSERAIEDLFDEKTLATKVEGKAFNREPKINPKTEYGKIVFAEKVIKANQNAINFDEFKEVFDRIISVIEDYSPIMATS